KEKLQQDDKKLSPEERAKRDMRLLDQLVEIEQTQRQIQKQLGLKADEGLRDKIARLQQMTRDNELPPSRMQDRLHNRLERLAEEALPQTTQRLAEARRELDARRSGKQQPQSKEGALDKAQSLQEETKNTIDELVRSLDPWANIHQVKSQAREILEKQREVE